MLSSLKLNFWTWTHTHMNHISTHIHTSLKASRAAHKTTHVSNIWELESSACSAVFLCVCVCVYMCIRPAWPSNLAESCKSIFPSHSLCPCAVIYIHTACVCESFRMCRWTLWIAWHVLVNVGLIVKPKIVAIVVTYLLVCNICGIENFIYGLRNSF